MRLDYSVMAATAVLVMVDWPAVADRLRPRTVPRGRPASETEPTRKEPSR
jgi:hypothetical protein